MHRPNTFLMRVTANGKPLYAIIEKGSLHIVLLNSQSFAMLLDNSELIGCQTVDNRLWQEYKWKVQL